MTSSSPHSSEEATHEGTPSTNITSFTPETANQAGASASVGRPKFCLSVSIAGPSSAAAGPDNQVTGDDVFLNQPGPSSGRSQLSPVAETFTPAVQMYRHAANASTTTVASFVSTESGQTAVGGAPIPVTAQHHTGSLCAVSTLVAVSTPEARAYRPVRGQDPAAAVGPIGRPVPFNDVPELRDAFGKLCVQPSHPRSVFLRDAMVAEGSFSTNGPATRALVVSVDVKQADLGHITAFFSVMKFPSVRGVVNTNIHTKGLIYVGFHDIRDAETALTAVLENVSTWAPYYIAPQHYATVLNASNVSANVIDMPTVSTFEGQLIVSVFYDGNATNLVIHPVIGMLKNKLRKFGDIKGLASMAATQAHVREFRVEFYDTRAAEGALTGLNQTVLYDFHIRVERYAPDLDTFFLPPVSINGNHYSPAQRIGFQPTPDVVVPHVQPDHEQLSVTGRSTVPVGEYDRLPWNLGPVHQAYLNGRGGPNHGGSGANHNQVDPNRIRSGQDVRTTIMLRNIPNKIDRAMLKEILDETSRGCYDFMYLRIDFTNSCNVGYAFINFIDALAIIPFAMARAGQRWNRFNSDKVAEISYATIQGKDCLVQKFRNSSVMLEHPSFRPRLFTTGAGPDAGQEEPFPPPDNISKMRRSVENAETVGLFYPTRNPNPRHSRRRALNSAARGFYDVPARATLPPSSTLNAVDIRRPNDPFAGRAPSNNSRLFAPRQGQAHRDEQRRRRSQFDRGTLGAQYEAYAAHGLDRQLHPAFNPYQGNVANNQIHRPAVNRRRVAGARAYSPDFDEVYRY